MQKVIAIFQSTHDVIKAERLCLEAGISCQAIPVPRGISTDCGIALELLAIDRARVEQLLVEHSVRPRFSPVGATA